MSSSQPKAKLAALVEKIKEQTDQGRLVWEATVDAGVFQTSLADYSVKISKGGKLRGGIRFDPASYKISIHNQEGTTVEEVTDLDLATVSPHVPFVDFFHVMESIYESARRSALGADQAIDSILASLGKGK